MDNNEENKKDSNDETLEEKLERLERENVQKEQDKLNLVEEIKELRKKKETEVVKQPEEKPKQESDLTEEERIALIVKKQIDKEKESVVESNKKAAIEKFINDNKEFHESNDPTGLKRQALEDKFSRFNTNGLSEVKDFYSVIEEANILLGRSDKTQNTFKEVPNPYSSSTFTPAQQKASEDLNGLSIKEQKLIQEGKISKEKLLKLKETQPAFFRSLIESIN